MKAEKFGVFIIFFLTKVCIFLLTIFYLLFIITAVEAGNERTVALIMKALSNP
ncbi:MAG: hypothetical protein JRF56_05425 [Deltaproteobacteria bacterium]|nr:hypothetical protein [Deltaproteobacteria bacterium]